MSEFVVQVWEEQVTIPTYGVGHPEKNPMFFEKRVYQGSSGVVYPNPVIEKIHDTKTDKRYTGLFLENRYLKIMVLPEIGGRIQMAYDKIKQRHFIYYNQVIKPALVGLCGPWISGGIEFNWPQHHRPSTFDPVDYTSEEHADGSKTIWVNEVERMFGTKALTGFTLHPDRAYIEVKATLYNRTALPQTFLWWANPAVKVNDDYQSVFPPDVNAVFDHGKRDVATFPIATGTYYKVDYSPGTDISRYKNIPVPTSYMAIRSDYDFVGGYEHDTQAGLLHVANHHVSPGKKQWTWGCGDFGKAWDKNLTDEDGPYIELMTGVYTDNQPDFTWLMPFEEKTFTQYFLPYRELGMVKNATKDLLVAVDVGQRTATVKLFATSLHRKLTLKLLSGQTQLFSTTIPAISPESIYQQDIPLVKTFEADDIILLVEDEAGNELIRYEPATNRENEVPEPAKAAKEPKDVENNEQLFLTGLHLEQYRHATYSPVGYYEEALMRDPADVRCNNALGKWYLRRGQFGKSEPYFRRAIQTLTQRNPNPYDGEPYYNLGLSLTLQGKRKEAYEAFYKSVWNSAWQGSGYFSLAQLDAVNGHWETALDHVQRSLDRNAGNSKARVLKAHILRRMGQLEAALQVCSESRHRDLFNLAAYFEQSKIHASLGNAQEAKAAADRLATLARGYPHNYIEYALDYAAAGAFHDATEMLSLALDEKGESPWPMVSYYLGWFQLQAGDHDRAQAWFKKGSAAPADHCFPNRLQDVVALQAAMSVDSDDAKAPYYLGNLWYDKRQYSDAITHWELSAGRDDTFPTVFRNLGIAYYNKREDAQQALACFERAFALDTSDARVFMELDQLYKRLNRLPAERLALLKQHADLVEFRDDLYLTQAAIFNILGDHDMAYRMLMDRRFHPWEGGEGKVVAQYVYSLIELAKQDLREHAYEQAIAKLQLAQQYPSNLGEGKLFGTRENDIHYWLGCAYESLKCDEEASRCFEYATEGPSEPTVAIFYNDQQPDKIFYQGLAWQKLGKEHLAEPIFRQLLDYGKQHRQDEVKIDYFAVSLPDMLIFDDDLSKRNLIHCHYMMGLGYLGLGDIAAAKAAFELVMQHDTMHFGAATHLQMALLEEKVSAE